MIPKGQEELSGWNRRDFLKTSAFLGGCALLAPYLERAQTLLAQVPSGEAFTGGEYELAKPERALYSVCLQCHTACTIKCKVLDGVLVKIDGNPYGPQTLLPQLPYASSPWKAAPVDGKLCPKGQAGVQTLYDPYRLRKVLKRAGRRGENKWITIPFEQAIREIVEGGRLFRHVPGEENRQVPGLKDLFVLRDPKLARELAEDAARVLKKEMSLSHFQAKHRSHLSLLMDPDHPDLGPKNNQFCFLAGRIEHGRKEFSKRWLKGGFGSINWYEHTTICEQSHHIAYKQVSNQYVQGKWDKGKTHFKPDALNAEFILFFGTGAFEANFGPTNMAEKITEGLLSGRLRVAVVDPRLSKTAAKAWKWVPIKPGTDAALALGMIRWILEEERYDRRYLENANRAAALADGEPTWSNASWLVRLEERGRPGALLRARDVDLEGEDAFVISRGGVLKAFHPQDEAQAVEGDLWVRGEKDGVPYISVLQLLKEEALSKSLEGWAAICEVEPETVIALARELTSHGKKAAVEFYRGPVQHTNGYYTAQTLIALNLLIGNVDWMGGLTQGGGHWHEMGEKRGGPFNLKEELHPGKLTAFGIPLTREGWHYEESSLFSGYPARRPWYPFTDNVYQEVLPSAADGYPYSIKALFLHMGTPVYATPAGHLMIDYLRDVEKLPLFFADDVVVGETSMYADYIFPDLSIWERWGTPHQTPDVVTKGSKVRQPVVGPIPEEVWVFGEKVPCSMEAVMLAVAERLGLPGYGKDGFGPDMDFTRPEDFYLKMVANIAAGDREGEEVPRASRDELKLFHKSRSHLPKSVYQLKRWVQAVGERWWPHVVYVLNRGGRFENFTAGWRPPYVAHRFGGQLNLYVEPVALARNSMTGKPFSGLPHYEPIKDSLGREVRDDGFPFFCLTYKDITGGQSRTVGNYWTQIYRHPENGIVMNAADAQRLGLKEGDRARILSRSNPEGVWDLGNGYKVPMEGIVHVVQGLKPGVVLVSWHYGHWANGAADLVVDGRAVRGETQRATGLCANAALRVDEHLRNVCLSDPIGGSSSFYDTRIQVVRV